MLRSMTGFARGDLGSAFGDLTWELRAVNHRYLDVQFRLPEELRPYEAELRRQVGDAVGRGKLDCGFFLKRPAERYGKLTLNAATLSQLHDVLDTLSGEFASLASANPLEILRWPGVVEDTPVEPDALFTDASELLANTLASLNRMRAREGERLRALLLERCSSIEAVAGDVRDRRPSVIDAARQKLSDRIERFLTEADPSRLEAEIALLAQKLDVDEELDRLDSHLVEVRTVLARSEPVGRRLDFLMQELNREANTLASKSGDATTTRCTVDLKVFIEQMREQVQNIE